MLFTIGHSNHSIQRFIELLKQHQIEVVADVRSSPFSRLFPQFNAESLRQSLKLAVTQYVPMGHQLGGRPKDDSFYDAEGHADYAKMAQDELFLEGLERLKKGIKNYHVAVMCSEENPNECHRRLLIVRALCEHDSAYIEQIRHIRRNGQLQDESELLREEPQKLLTEVESKWRSPKSIQSALPTKVLKPSSTS